MDRLVEPQTKATRHTVKTLRVQIIPSSLIATGIDRVVDEKTYQPLYTSTRGGRVCFSTK